MSKAKAKKRIVLDASALIAYLLDEEGGRAIGASVRSMYISAVNYGEVAAKFSERGMPEHELREMLAVFECQVVPFDAEMAIISGVLRRQTLQAGLSFADRACLALGKTSGAIVYTCDAAWEKLDLGIEIELIR